MSKTVTFNLGYIPFVHLQINIPKICISWISCDNGMENLKSKFWSFVIEAQGNGFFKIFEHFEQRNA